MITLFIILGILTVFIIGFVQVYNRHSRVVKKIDFAGEYRNKFVEFAKKYFQTYDRYSHSGDFDGELYKNSFVVGSSAVLQMNFCAKNSLLRKGANR